MCALVVYSTESKWNKALRSRIAALPPTAVPPLAPLCPTMGGPAWHAGVGCDGREGMSPSFGEKGSGRAGSAPSQCWAGMSN